jgi:hypothetical protein
MSILRIHVSGGMDMAGKWNLELEGKPDFEMAMNRIEAWYAGEMLDRPPIRFSRHNALYDTADKDMSKWKSLKERWFDIEYQLDRFKKSIAGKKFQGETFPVYWPNLGPNVYAAFYGGELEFNEVTSWVDHIIQTPEDVHKLSADPKQSQYFRQLEKMTAWALEECPGKYMVGYTDLHPGLDCVMDWRGQEQLCLDFYDNPELVRTLVGIASRDLMAIYDHFDAMLKAWNQLSVSWMEIPSFGKMHIPSCDFSTLISPELFAQYYLPVLQAEVKSMTHNIFHLDGKGVARHLDYILDIPEINAIQWVQGVGDDQPILQWVPLIKKIQKAGKSVVVDLEKSELNAFLEAVEPQGLFLCMASENEEEELAILKRITRW